MAWEYLQEADIFKGWAERRRRRRRCQGLLGLLPGQGSAAFGGADHRGHRGSGRVQQHFLCRTSKCGSGGAVLRRDAAPERGRAVLTWKSRYYFSSSSIGRHLPSRACDSQRRFGIISGVFDVNMNSDPEVVAPFALKI